MLGLTTAGAAGLGAPAVVWIAMLVLAAVFGVIAAMRWREERRAVAPEPPAASVDEPTRSPVEPMEDRPMAPAEERRSGTGRTEGTRESPAQRLNESLRRGMALRATLLLEDRGHWEGDELVLPDPTPISEDPLYVWARETYDLLREHFPAHADDFYGDDPGLGAEHFALPYSVEVRRGSREAYLERRIAVLRDAAKP